MKPQIYLALALHNHQPVGNFDHVIEEAYQKSYLPMLEALERHPGVRLALHNTGCLLDWLTVHRPEYIERLAALVARGQVEIMTGGYYEPILVSLPDKDKDGQIKKLTRTVARLFNYNATGAWLAERVWEPHLPLALNHAGVAYTIVDDTHFRYAGLNDDDMFGYYITEEQGEPLKIFGTAKHLRYTIPWVPVPEVIAWLKEQSERDLPLYAHVARVAVMGDDGEKFGLWPRTYKHCWEDGWVEEFFTALEENSDWLQTITPGDYAAQQPALGQLYMPAASYDEMTEWALPSASSAAIVHLKHELQEKKQDDILRFIKGGLWRGFLAKYPEVNQMHKKALWVSRKIHTMARGKERQEALDKLWAAQCNCGYWHGLFGGIYLFHIRGINYRNLIEAEMLAKGDADLTVEHDDFTRNGLPDLIIANQHQWLLFDPQNGGSVVEWDFRDAPYNLLNTVSRRPEPYHEEIRKAAAAGTLQLSSAEGAVENVHSTVVKVKEFGLEHKLVYDWYRRAALQDRFLYPDGALEQYALMQGERGDFVNQPYRIDFVEQTRRVDVALYRDGGVWQDGEFMPVRVHKEVVLERGSNQLHVHYQVTNNGTRRLNTRFGIENNWGLEGGQDPLTWFDGLETADGQRRYPAQAGTADNIAQYALVSDIITVRSRIALAVSQPASVWWYPIESVTNSEAGYEANYQGTAVLTSWLLDLPPGETWQVALTFTLTTTV